MSEVLWSLRDLERQVIARLDDLQEWSHLVRNEAQDQMKEAWERIEWLTEEVKALKRREVKHG